jgi:uncharacterized protein
MALKASPDDQALLLDLQAFDTRLAQLDHRAKSIPEIATLAGFEKNMMAIALTLAEQNGGLEDITIELKRIESDVVVVETRITRDNDRVQSSSSVKDVAALEQELVALRKRLGDLEEIELAVMQRMEDQQREVDKTSAQRDALASRTAEIEVEKDASLITVASERTVAAAGRRAVEEKVPADLLALYEKQRSRYGTGASMLRGGVSLASGVKLLENEMQAIRAASPDEVIMCASSEAILVRTPESGL